MTDNNEKEQSKLRVKDIARPKSVIHPALDWVKGQLVVGVVFENGHRAALTSKDGLVEIEKIGNVCERDGKFESPVTPEMAEQFITYLETNPTSYPREDLSALLLELAVSASLKRIHFCRFGVGHLARRRVRNTPVRWLLHTGKQS